MKFNECLRFYRNAKEMSLTDLSLALKRKGVLISAPTLQRYESGYIKNVPYETIENLADIFNVSPIELMGWNPNNGIKKIPVLGKVAAGSPLHCEEQIIGYENIAARDADKGDYVGLVIKGDSMSPKIENGDIVIIRKQEDVESGEIAIVIINGDDATCKKIIKNPAGITLIGLNQTVYEPHFYSNAEIQNMPIRIFGKVVQVRKNL